MTEDINMDILISVENMKCGGCANSIRHRLAKIKGVLTVEVDVQGEIVILTSDHDVRMEAIEALSSLGYPEKGHSEGLGALKSKAKSLVSCALGKLSSSE
jgi:copper chaperone